MKPRKKRNACFVCGPDNPHGLHLQFAYERLRHRVQCRLKLPARYQGATGYAHGGMIATLLDEAMAKSNGLSGIRAVTLRLTTSYRKLVPVRKFLNLAGWRLMKRGRKLYLRSQLRDSRGTLLAEAKGLFLTV